MPLTSYVDNKHYYIQCYVIKLSNLHLAVWLAQVIFSLESVTKS